MLSFKGEISRSQLKQLRKALAELALPPAKRQRLLWRLAKYGGIAAAKRHVRQQVDPDGQAWEKRKTKRKGKMLRDMPKHLHIRDLKQQSAVRIYLQGGAYRNGAKKVPAGIVGGAQQNGMTATISRRQVTRSTQAAAERGEPCTVRQAKRLRALDYKVKKGKRWRKPGYKEIQEKLTKAQAGPIINKLMAEEGKPPKASWAVTLPPRQFLGMSDEEFNNALARQLQAIGYGWDVKAQDVKGNI